MGATDAYPVSIKLVDSAGSNLTEHSYVTGAYSITDAGPNIFYLPTDIRAEIVGIRFWNSSAQTLSVKLEIRIGSATWIEIPAYTTGVLDATAAQTATMSYPLRSFLLQGTEMRVSCTVGGETTTSVQVICVAVR